MLSPPSPPPAAPLGNFSVAIQLQGADYLQVVASPLTYVSLIKALQMRAADAMQVRVFLCGGCEQVCDAESCKVCVFAVQCVHVNM